MSDTDDEGGGNDSFWAVIAGFVKSFGCTFEYALYEISYANMILYMRTLPSYTPPKEGKGAQEEETLDADDPANRDKILKILNGNG